MIKYITIWCSLFIFSTNIFAQDFTSDYTFLYNLEYKRKDNSFGIEQFYLLINSKEAKSSFLSYPIYKLNKLKKRDLNSLMENQTEFSEVVVSHKNNFNVYEDIIDYKYSYYEPNIIEWKILKERKKIGKYNCKLAKCSAYGRSWSVWYTSDVALNYGPYKFNGLPGLIVALNDDENKFHFTLQDFGKHSIKFNLPNKKDYKLINKSNYYKNRFKILTADNGSIIFENTQERKKWFAGIYKFRRNHPMLDIEFPQE